MGIGITLLGLMPEYRDRVRILPERPGRDQRQRQHGNGKGRKYACWPSFHFNLRSASLGSGLRLDESFRRHFEPGYALDKGCFQLADAINQT